MQLPADMTSARSVAGALGACAIVLLLTTAGCAGPPARPTLVVTYAGHPGAEKKKNCRPEYPAAAARAKAQGNTTIRFTIDAKGVVTQADIVQSSGPTPEHRLLDEAARMALEGCPIKIGTDASGQPIGATMDVVYRWVIAAPDTAAPALTPR